jgi:hypothetical protein
VRRVDASLSHTTVWCKRSNFAKLLGISEATVYRILDKLESMNLVVRDEQSRSRTGALSVAAIRFTKSALDLLGFDPSLTKGLFHGSSTTHRLAPVKDLNQEDIQFSSRTQSCDPVDKVPEDLRELNHARGLSTPQIFKLMKIASTRKQRLSDVWSLVKRNVPQQIAGSSLFAYLRKIINSEKDWSYIATKERTKFEKTNDNAMVKKSREDLYFDHAGRTFSWGSMSIEACAQGTGFLTGVPVC